MAVLKQPSMPEVPRFENTSIPFETKFTQFKYLTDSELATCISALDEGSF